MKKYLILIIAILFTFNMFGQNVSNTNDVYIFKITCKNDIIEINQPTYTTLNPNQWIVDADKAYPCGRVQDWFTGASISKFKKAIAPNDTFQCLAATSCLMGNNGVADDWYILGPFPMPAGGSYIKWKQAHEKYFQEGFEIILSTTGHDYTSDFTDAPIYKENQLVSAAAGDSVWIQKAVNIPSSYNGKGVYFGLHHFGTNGGMMYFDAIECYEGKTTLGINKENNLKVRSTYPNPAKNLTTLEYTLNNSSNIDINIFDISGRMVYSKSEGTLNAGDQQIIINVADFDNGVYYYTIKSETNNFNGKLSVIK